MRIFSICNQCSRIIGCVCKINSHLQEDVHYCESCSSQSKHCKNHVFTSENIIRVYCKKCESIFRGGG